jgi:hypothetical protein
MSRVIVLRFFIAGVMTVVFERAVFAQTPPAPFSIAWDTNASSVRAVGTVAPELRKLDADELQRIFPVVVEQSNVLGAIGLPPIIGAYTVTAKSIEFRPRYPFEPGLAYRATFVPASVTSVLRVPRPPLVRTTVVTQIYPSANVLPQNLLKFYLHFSAPMSGGRIYEHIHLAQEDGTPVELPFLEIDEELWNPEMTRLTLFLDPGRIKREVRPLEEVGPALVPGKSYTLTIDEAWRDARGAPLEKPFQKQFAVTPADREPPDPAGWQIRAPRPATRDPLQITFSDPMDQALALRMISVKEISGRTTLGENEKAWRFEPDQPWNPGRHELLVQSTIEDIAGNNIGKPFEVEIDEGDNRRDPARIIPIPFEIR